jgi:hypothetical protein
MRANKYNHAIGGDFMIRFAAAALGAALLVSGPALAQDDETPEPRRWEAAARSPRTENASATG